MSKIEYFDLLDKWIAEYPDKKVVIDNQGDMTYRQMDEESARVYSWLKAHGIGREDFVMIHLPRTAKVISAIQGIFKAGAAYVIAPLDFPPERLDFEYKDCGCRILLTQDVYDEMMQYEPLDGREDVDLHDAVYAVYTSGTQGTPKGALHEYGNLDQTWKSAYCDGEPFVTFNDVYGLIAPLNFAVMNFVSVHGLANGGTIYFAPTEIVKNPDMLIDAFEKAGVTVTYLPPSFLKVLSGFNTQLRKLMVASEVVRGVYFDGLFVINAHGMSETCFETATFRIDRAYDRPPIGKPQFDNKFSIIDGEYCFENRYFRGYINRPELTARCMAGGVFHSGDTAQVLEDGNIVLTGRKDSMLKINGNRVEPGEVEGILKQQLGLKHVVVKGYKEPKRTYLCAYYTDDVQIDPPAARKKLLNAAPGYMIPDYYVKLDSFPLIGNGKMDYQALKKPDINDYRRPYAAPVTDIEKKLCSAYEEVLGLEHIGLDDDFFELGGDSMGAIALALAVNTEGCTSAGIYDLRTPRAVAERIEGAQRDIDHKAVTGDVPAEEYSQYMLDYEEAHPCSSLFTVLRVFRINEKGSGDAAGTEDAGNPGGTILTDEMKHRNELRILESLEKTCVSHPQLQSVFVKKDGQWLITKAPEKMRKPVAEHMSEAEFEEYKGKLEHPFAPGECVYDLRLIRTEKNLYLINAFNHAAVDGRGVEAFRRSFAAVYGGGVPAPDHYLECRAQIEAEKHTDRYEADRKYLEEKFSGRWESIPRPDHDGTGLYGVIDCSLPDWSDTGNVQSLAAVLSAMAAYNDTEEVMATWTYHNRDTRERRDCVGLFIRDIPAGIRICRNDSRDDILRKVSEEIEDGIRHMSCQWSMHAGRDIIYTVTQGNLRDFKGLGELECEPIETEEHTGGVMADNPMDVEFYSRYKGKGFILRYNSGMYDASSAERFCALIRKWYEQS